MLGQRRPDQLRADEHRRLGGHSAAGGSRPRSSGGRRIAGPHLGSGRRYEDVADVGAGASWIFSRDDLAARDARRSHERRAADARSWLSRSSHRARLVRLRCIKWVDRIELVADEAPATTQMREFAARTHQPTEQMRAGEPAPARDFIPAMIDTAAMPVRVEKWLVDGRLEYRIAGIIWGGSTPTNALSIRFKANEPWIRVDDCPMPASDAHVEPVVARVAAGRARPLSDRAASGRSDDPHAPARSVLLRAGNRDRRGLRRNRRDRRGRKARHSRRSLRSLRFLRCRPGPCDAAIVTSARISASSGRSLSARCHAARNSFAAFAASAGGPADGGGAREAEQRRGAAGRPRERRLELRRGRRRVAGAEQDLAVQLAGRLDRIRARDRPRPLRLELRRSRQRSQRAGPVVSPELASGRRAPRP